MQEFDPIAMEVFSNRLLTITEEMGITLVRASFSPNIKERKDCSVALFDARGRLVSQASHIPMHLGALEGGVRTILGQYALDEIQDGDVFMCNDAYLAGGTHSPDITLVTPILFDGKVRFFASNLGHHSDVGGSTPGSVSPTARTIFDEGLRIPLVKVVRNGLLDADILSLVTCNSREPEDRTFDLKVQIAANERGKRLVLDLLDKFGLVYVEKSIEDLLAYTERRLRNRIRSIGNRSGSFITYLDDDGFGGDPVPIEATITVEGDSLSVDFEGTGPQARGGYNMPAAALNATVYYCVKTMLDPELMPNEGMASAVTIKAPKGSLANPDFPGAVGMRSCTAQPFAGAVIGAFNALLPLEQQMAAGNDAMPALVVSGRSRRRQGSYVYVETIGGGAGALFDSDGADGTHVHITNSSNLPAEALENEYPLLVEEYCLIPDSGGAGEFRGGLGIARQIRVLDDDTYFYASSEKTVIVPDGVQGGSHGSNARIISEPGTAQEEHLPANRPGRPLQKNACMRLETPGGGGFGAPSKRSPKRLAADLRDGKISLSAAKLHYGSDQIEAAQRLLESGVGVPHER